jgi:hypothetical protein
VPLDHGLLSTQNVRAVMSNNVLCGWITLHCERASGEMAQLMMPCKDARSVD